jgi:hypothetical protein
MIFVFVLIFSIFSICMYRDLPLSAFCALVIGSAGMIGLRMDWVDWRKKNV